MEGSLEPGLLAEVRALLPAWIPWARWALVAACGILLPALGSGTSLLGVRRGLRREPPAHWTQAARHYYALHLATAAYSWSAVGVLLWLTGTIDNQLTHGEPWCLLLSGLVLVEVLTVSIRRCFYPRLFGSWLTRIATWQEHVGSFLALESPLYMALVMAVGLPPVPSGPALLVALAGTAWILFAMSGGGFRLLERLGLARELRDPWVEQEVGTRKVRVLSANLTQVNALAVPLQRMVVFGTRVLEVLDERERRGILRHELAHLAESRSLLLLLLPVWVAVLTLAWARPLIACLGARAWVGLLLAVFLVLRWRRGRLHRHEERADVEGAREEASIYARALEKIHSVQLLPAVMRGKRTHPDLYDRMLAAGAQPAYERPAPPSPLTAWCVIPLAACLVGVGELGRSTLPESWQSSDEERGELRALAFGEHLAFPLSRIAQRRFLAGRPTEALTFYRAASSLEPESPWHAASMCLTLGRLERCEEARQELERARRLAQDASADEDLEELMADAERAQRSCERRARRAAK